MVGKVELVSPRREVFKGLGELSPGEIAALFPQRTAVTPQQIAIARVAWSAFRSADPRDLEPVLQGDTTALPFLAAALARHLEEFPSQVDGLSRSERRLMEQAIDGPVELRAVFPRMHEGESAFYLTDTMLIDRARVLAASSPALLTLTGDDPAAPLPAASIALTSEGREVLSGRADRVRLCGLDRWLGGVRLTGHGPVWRWCGTEVRLR